MHRNPRTPEQWRTAVDLADVMLSIQSARCYGLIEGGPVVDVTRCLQILALGETRGFKPSADAVERILPILLQGLASAESEAGS